MKENRGWQKKKQMRARSEKLTQNQKRPIEEKGTRKQRRPHYYRISDTTIFEIRGLFTKGRTPIDNSKIPPIIFFRCDFSCLFVGPPHDASPKAPKKKHLLMSFPVAENFDITKYGSPPIGSTRLSAKSWKGDFRFLKVQMLDIKRTFSQTLFFSCVVDDVKKCFWAMRFVQDFYFSAYLSV